MKSDFRRKQAYPLTKIGNIKFGELIYQGFIKGKIFTKKGIKKKYSCTKIYREYISTEKIYAHPELYDKLIEFNKLKG